MQNLKRTKSILDYFESSVALFAVIAIVLLSGLVVYGMNPRAAKSSEEGEVAGVSTTLNPLEIKNQYERFRHEVIFTDNQDNREFKYEITIKSMDRGEEIVSLVDIKNTDTIKHNLNFNLSIEGYIEDELQIQILDEEKSYTLKNFGEYKDAEIQIQPGEVKKLKIKYYSEVNINFPYTVKINTNY